MLVRCGSRAMDQGPYCSWSAAVITAAAKLRARHLRWLCGAMPSDQVDRCLQSAETRLLVAVVIRLEGSILADADVVRLLLR